MNCKEYLELTPEDLIERLSEEFICDIPVEINTVDDFKLVSVQMNKTANQYAFLMQLASYAKIYSRLASRSGDKMQKENFIDKKEIINNVVDAVKLRYTTLSRMITIKQEINKEINMI